MCLILGAPWSCRELLHRGREFMTTDASPRAEAPATWGSRLRLIGPGLVVAATGVGAGDMVSSLTAGTQFGTVLIWAIILGALLKFALTEGLGRWYMASKTTVLEGWHSMG